MTTEPTLLDLFEAVDVDTTTFHHPEHVHVAFAMLNKYSYLDACEKYARTIKAMAIKADAPEKFNLTITFAFMSLIADRKSQTPNADLEAFLAANPDVLDKQVLMNWYSVERLQSAEARERFLLPDKLGSLAA